MTQQPADAGGGSVALLTRVAEQRLPPRPAKHQTRAQTGGAATNDNAIPSVVHAQFLLDTTPSLLTEEGTAIEFRGAGTPQLAMWLSVTTIRSCSVGATRRGFGIGSTSLRTS